MLRSLFRVCTFAVGTLLLSTTAGEAMVRLPSALKNTFPVSEAIQIKERTRAPMAHIRFCGEQPEQCAQTNTSAEVTLTSSLWRQLNRVNASVNRTIRPQVDSLYMGIADRWQVGVHVGDCEDYALTKRHRLIRLGWPANALLIATAHAPDIGWHAVLVVRTDHGDYVLDNLEQKVLPWTSLRYTFHSIQSPKNPRHWMAI